MMEQLGAARLAFTSRRAPGRFFASSSRCCSKRSRSAADPDGALDQFVRFVEAYGFRSLLFELLAVEPAPARTPGQNLRRE